MKSKNKWWSVLFVFYFLNAPIVAHSETIQLPRSEEQISTGTIVKFDYSGTVEFCGNEKLLVSHGKVPGLKLLNITSGAMSNITSNKFHHGVACSSNGETVYYVDNQHQEQLRAISTEGKNDTLVFDNTHNNFEISKTLFSESGLHIAVPDDANINPESIRFLPDPIKIPKELLNNRIQSFTWCSDDFLYLLSSGNASHGTPKQFLTGINLSTGSKFTQVLPSKQWFYSNVRCNAQDGFLYFHGWKTSGTDDIGYLYKMHPNALQDMNLVKSDIYNFWILPTGEIMYQKDVKDASAKKITPYIFQINSDGGSSAVYSGAINNLRISSDGKRIVFVTAKNGKDVIVILPLKSN